MTDVEERLALAPCPFCGGEAEIEIGKHNFEDAEVRCVACNANGPTFDNDAAIGGTSTNPRKDAAEHWNTRLSASAAPGAGGEQTVVVERLQRCVEKLERLETLPRPYDLYYAVKNEGQGTGWTYTCAGIGILDLRVILDRLSAPPSNGFEAGLRAAADWHLDRAAIEKDISVSSARAEEYAAAAIAAIPIPAGEESEWRPIETAPKDMTEIIVLCGPKDVRLGWYFAPSSTTFGWFDQRQKPITPTHWMPLPEVPKP